LVTIPWFYAEPLLKGNLIVTRAEGIERERLAEGPAEHLVPHIRGMLMYNERLELTGPQAVIHESELGDLRNNPLEVQRDYFAKIIEENPRDDTMPFALAQVLRELGNKDEADNCYDRGISVGKRNWYRKLPFFLLPSVVAAPILWLLSFAPWLGIVVAVLGLGLWMYIFRNRQHWLPIVGMARRAEAAAHIDMAAALAQKELQLVKNIIGDSITFRIIDNGLYFPPLPVLNLYLGRGSDPADQDHLGLTWPPFEIDDRTYQRIKKWWNSMYPDAKEDWLGLDPGESDLSWFAEAYDRL